MRLTSRSIRIGFPAEDGRLWLNMRMFLDGTTGFASLNRPAVQPVVEGSDGHYLYRYHLVDGDYGCQVATQADGCLGAGHFRFAEFCQYLVFRQIFQALRGYESVGIPWKGLMVSINWLYAGVFPDGMDKKRRDSVGRVSSSVFSL